MSMFHSFHLLNFPRFKWKASGNSILFVVSQVYDLNPTIPPPPLPVSKKRKKKEKKKKKRKEKCERFLESIDMHRWPS